MISQSKKALAAAAIVTAWTSTAHAAADCKALMTAYDHASKLISLEDAKGLGDDSVYRAILHEMTISNYFQVRLLNLHLMELNKCPIPSNPVYSSEYTLQALECSTEQLKGNHQSPKCDLAKWERTRPSD